MVLLERQLRGLRGKRRAELVGQHEGRLVLNVEITRQLQRGRPLGCVHEQADRRQKIDKGRLAGG